MNSIGAIFTGFDSAWTDNPKRPGAIASILDSGLGRLRLVSPKPATFNEAQAEILTLAKTMPIHVVGIDQPTIVPNAGGSRPVERVAGHLIGKMKGGVQPANRSRVGMFDDDAPIWMFLSSLPHKQSPFHAIRANSGRYIMEVYPALTILGLFPFFITRGCLPKYNPENRKQFRLCDWRRLTYRISRYGRENGIEAMVEWATSMMTLSKPTKSDQDGIDAVICAIEAYHWWTWGCDRSVVIGDQHNGYIVAAVTPWMKDVLNARAKIHSVPFNKRW